MWVNRELFQRILDDNKAQAERLIDMESVRGGVHARMHVLIEQKAKDDITIDWMRHRVNALEKQNSILLGKATGVLFPVPEIVPTRPGTLSTADLPDFATMPSFEDVGEAEALRQGISHEEDGSLKYER